MGGGYNPITNLRGYCGSYITIFYSNGSYRTLCYLLHYDSNSIYVADNNWFEDDRVVSAIARYNNITRVIVSYDESDNITMGNCKLSDSALIDNLIDMQPVCWQQYINRDGAKFAVFAFPLK